MQPGQCQIGSSGRGGGRLSGPRFAHDSPLERDGEVGERLRAEIERERSGGVQYWVLSDHRNGEFVGCGGLRPWLYTPGEVNFEVGFHLVKRCWGKGFATEAVFGTLEYAWEKLQLSQVYAGHHPQNRASEKILKKLGFEFIGMCFTNQPA
jgi:RimJ/RimL family protein N-acetyltransferase